MQGCARRPIVRVPPYIGGPYAASSINHALLSLIRTYDPDFTIVLDNSAAESGADKVYR